MIFSLLYLQILYFIITFTTQKENEMPRIRTIKPKFWDDSKVGKLSRNARLLYIGMWNFADDLGVVISDSVWLKSKIFPYDQIQIQQLGKWITELVENGFICLLSYHGERFIYLPTFTRHQVINRPNMDDLNVPKHLIDNLQKLITEQSLINHGIIIDVSLLYKEEEYRKKILLSDDNRKERKSTSKLETKSSISRLKEQLLSQPLWVEALMREFGFSENEVPGAISDALNEIVLSGKEENLTMQEAKSYCRNVIRKKRNARSSNSSNGQWDKRLRDSVLSDIHASVNGLKSLDDVSEIL